MPDGEAPRRHHALTTRQAQVVELVANGCSNREIAARLAISEDGVKAHIRRLLVKFDVSNRAALVHAVNQPEPAAELSLRDLLQCLARTLAESVGSTAALNLLRRAAKRAGQRDPDFPLSPAATSRPIEQWPEVRGARSVQAFSAIVRELWPLLLAAAGDVLVQQLERHGVPGAGVTDEDEVISWASGR